MVDTEKAIYLTDDEPEFVHHALERILQKTLQVMSMWEGTPADMIEIGGGAGVQHRHQSQDVPRVLPSL